MRHQQSEWQLPVNEHLDTPSVARVYDYYLGGTTNWDIDRSFGDHVLEHFPLMRRIAFVHRLFLNRIVRYLLQQGVRQFLDVGSGVPSAGSTHDVADEWALWKHQRPDSRVVYVDNDPVAVAHTELLLEREADRDRHAILFADLRRPENLWQQLRATELLDLDQPIGLLMIGLLHLQQRDLDGTELGPTSAAELQRLLPPGSYVAISHVTTDGMPPAVLTTLEGLRTTFDESGPVTWRTHTEIEAMLGETHLVDPGWTSALDWRPNETGPNAPRISLPLECRALIWAGLGQKI